MAEMWMQEARESIERRGTAGKCSEGGAKGTMGSKECPEGSRQYALAKTFKKIARRRKNRSIGSYRGTARG